MSVHPSGMLLDESAADTKKPAVHNPLEQFVLLAKGRKGAHTHTHTHRNVVF